MRPRASTHAHTQTRMHRYNDTLIIIKGRTCWIAGAREASACRNQASEEKERGRGDHTLCVLRVVLRKSAADRRHQLHPRNARCIPSYHPNDVRVTGRRHTGLRLEDPESSWQNAQA